MSIEKRDDLTWIDLYLEYHESKDSAGEEILIDLSNIFPPIMGECTNRVDLLETEISEEERLAAEWAALAEDSGPDSGSEGVYHPRVLSQDDINSLLGFDDSPEVDNFGIMAIVNSSISPYAHRLPQFDRALHQMVICMNDPWREITGDNVEITIDQISTVRIGDFLNAQPLPAMFSVYNLNGRPFVIHMDSALIYSMVDVSLGGRRGIASMRIEGRPYTEIERDIVKVYFDLIAENFATGFRSIIKQDVEITHVRIETNPRFISIVYPHEMCIQGLMRADMEDRGGRYTLVIPHSTVEPYWDDLRRFVPVETDPLWSTHMGNEALKISVPVTASLEKIEVPLGEVLGMGVGSKIVLRRKANDPLVLSVGDRQLGRGKLDTVDGWNIIEFTEIRGKL